MPATYIIGPDGKIVASEVGSAEWNSLGGELLGEARGRDAVGSPDACVAKSGATRFGIRTRSLIKGCATG